MKQFYLLLLLIQSSFAFSQTINITVNAAQGHRPISPWIYGRNNSLSDQPSNPVSAANLQKYRDAGLRMFRENGGNNCTKYNWRLKLSSHPDWYNNVYDHNWDYSVTTLLNNTINTQGLYAFQLLGKASFTKSKNFDDWGYSGSDGTGAGNNWAGGGGPAPFGNGGNGNPDLYLFNWTADSTTGILDHWFDNLDLDPNRLQYWNMDNEPEIWKGTHDDVASSSITAEDYMQRYFTVAKKARAKYPNIKLVGPVSTNEWQWYTWNDDKVTHPVDGKSYSWMEYFIKRIAEEQQATGIRLLDVLDVHFYPGTASNPDLTLQLHRIWFDNQWIYPNANGVKVTGTSGWDNTINKEYFFERCNQWLTQHIGADHGVTFGISECGAIANHGSEDPNIISCWYASHLGTFANHGVELFTPWDWYKGQWEVLHLFSNYYGKIAAQATSSQESVASAYSSLSEDGDSLMIAIVNRDKINSRTIAVTLQNFIPSESTVNGYALSGLPSNETFVSKSNNALQNKQFTITDNTLSISVPALSVTLIQIPTAQPVITGINKPQRNTVQVFPNPAKNKLIVQPENQGEYRVNLKDLLGKTVASYHLTGTREINISALEPGYYLLEMIQNDDLSIRKFIKE